MKKKRELFLYDERPYHIVDRSKVSPGSQHFPSGGEDTAGPDWLQSVEQPQAARDKARKSSLDKGGGGKPGVKSFRDLSALKSQLPDLTAMSESKGKVGGDVAPREDEDTADNTGEDCVPRPGTSK